MRRSKVSPAGRGRRASVSSVIVGVVALLVAVGAAGCTSDEPRSPLAEQSSPFQPCPLARVGPGAATLSPLPPDLPVDQRAAGQPPFARLPAVSLPCFTGGGSVELARLGRAMIINVWASWCAPCRKELPEFQRFSSAAGDTVTVLGVISSDTRSAAAALGRDLSVTFPMMFDATAQLQRSLARLVLPITLFVDAQGLLRYVHATGALTLPALVNLAHEHLGVVVS